MNKDFIITSFVRTEKATGLKNSANIYIFRVLPSANKHSIKKAVEKMFSVKVISVRTVSIPGKTKRMGRYEGKRSDCKKAYVRLEKGQTIKELAEK